MKLTELFASEKQVTDHGNKQVNSVNNSIINRQIRAMVPGQIIQGEVISRNGSELQLKLADDLVLQARLEQILNLEIGKNMTFEVKNNGRALMLSPLFTNVAMDANVLKALEMASLPVNDTTVTLTRQMMEAGLPIDRNTLQQVCREVSLYPQAETTDIVNLHKLQIPVNESNIEQASSYRNLTHQLVNGLDHVLDAIPDMFTNMVETGNTQGATGLYQQLVTLAQESVPEEMGFSGTNQIENVGELAETVNVTDAAASKAAPLNMTAGEENASGAVVNSIDTVTITENNADQLNQITKNLADFPLRAQLERRDILKPVLDLLKNQWTITPEEVADAAKVEKLYSRLDRQLKNLAQTMEGLGQTTTTAYKAVTNLSQNLDFMQQMNQMYTYVQLPLRLQQGEAHGDLYVYTNKKHLAAKDGQISALLHLDMEYLGPVDVYVSMAYEKVNTKFYLQDDELLDFMMEHMDILLERLKKRGYQCSFEMQVREQGEEAKAGIQKLLQQENHVPLAEYAFDVRT